jgi:hypothetical protein
MTNAEKADAAMIVLKWRAAERDGSAPGMDIKGVLEEEMIDLLADLKHLAKREGVDFIRALHMASDHFLEESEGR